MIFKKGDTFDFTGLVDVSDYQGNPISDLTGWTGRSQIRTVTQELVADLTFSWTDITNQVCRIRSTESTANWPDGSVYIDIEYTSPDNPPVIVSTSTGEFSVVDSPTV